MSASWLAPTLAAPSIGLATSALATPPVASSIPVRRTSKPGSRHGCQTASRRRWRQKRCPLKSRSGFSVPVGRSSSWSMVVTCSAGTPSSITSALSEDSSTR